MPDWLDWDDEKRQRNIALRGIDFADAERMDWTAAQIVDDDRNDYGEARFIARGTIDGRLHILVFTWREARLSVISLRRANARERRTYVRETGRSLGDT